MTETIEIEVSKHHKGMLSELREMGQSDPDADLRKLVEDAIHNGFQQSKSDQS